MSVAQFNTQFKHSLAVMMALAIVTGCEPDQQPDVNPDLEVIGVWNDNYGGWTVVDADHWGAQTVKAFDNNDNWAVTQNPSDAEYGPDAFSFVVWTEPAEDGSWWTCTVAYGLETVDEALMVEDTSDATDPSSGGCGDFAWTQMTPRDGIEVVGTWDDNYGGQTIITLTEWGTQKIHDYGITENWAVTQNPSDAEYGPNTFNLVVWTELDADQSWWTCTVAYGLETFDEAFAAEDTSDASDPANGGCGGFAWTQMTPAE